MKNNFNEYLLAAINNIAKEKDIDKAVIRDFLLESIKKAFIKSNYEDNIELSLDLNTGELKALKLFTVVEDNDDFDEYINILENDPRVKKEELKLGDVYKESFDISKEFRPQQVGQILQSFKQKITEISNQRVYKSWTPMINEVIMAEIEKEDKRGNFYTINLENQVDKYGNSLEPTLGFLGKKELNPLEELDVSKKYHFVVTEIKEQSKFCPVILSRASEKLVEYYMSLEIPEIDDGSIQIVKSARIAGFKTKVLVQPKVKLPIEAASICVGPKGNRVKNISKLLSGEKVEILNYHPNILIQLTYIFDKTKIIGIELNEEDKQITIVAESDSILPMIGKKGNNVKLASMLLGYAINIMNEADANNLNIKYININEILNQSDNLVNIDENIINNEDEINFMNLDENDINDLVTQSNDELFELNDENIEEFNDAFKDELEKVFNK